MSANKIPCLRCGKISRTDHMLRHLCTHRNNIPEWMPVERIQFMKTQKKPIIYHKDPKKGQSFAVCLHCQEGVYNKDASDVEAFFVCHVKRECQEHWIDYASLYDAPVKIHRVVKPRPIVEIGLTPPESESNTIQSDARSETSCSSSCSQKTSSIDQDSEMDLQLWAEARGHDDLTPSLQLKKVIETADDNTDTIESIQEMLEEWRSSAGVASGDIKTLLRQLIASASAPPT